MSFKPRPKQQEVLAYRSGKMGVSAVPGSGKTLTLSALAGQIVASDVLADDQEVLIVTLVNSAVDVFAGRVASFVQRQGLLPYVGYRVRTLHGLAHDIVRERPDLAGLAPDFQIIDESLASDIQREATLAWLRAHPHDLDDLLSPDLSDGQWKRVRHQDWPTLLGSVSSAFIRQAKDLQATPAELSDRLRRLLPQPLRLAEMCTAIYTDYQRSLAYRGAVDFDDLIRLALRVLELDQDYLERLRHRWPYILEDEAQDSSRLQEQILRLLTGPAGNWVRVGDPNQAIYESFTTANPRFLREFLDEPDVIRRELPNSGRSTASIIALANHLIEWTRREHPLPEVRSALAPPLIEPTPPGDPQPNPSDSPDTILLHASKLAPDAEVRAVGSSIARWLPDHPDQTVAVLVPRNERGFQMVTHLKQLSIPVVELLRSTRATRETADALASVASYLAQPLSPVHLAQAYRAWRRNDAEDEEHKARLGFVSKALHRCQQVEDFLWPRAERDWLASLQLALDEPEIHEHLIAFRDLVRRWQAAVLLPIDQLLLALAQDLFTERADLAVAHQLAGVLGRASDAHPEWQLPELTQELLLIARNERRFLGLGDEDSSFDPDRYKGQVVVATVHKAKGLEWDRVYLMSVNNYDYPSGQPHDTFYNEKWYVRDQLSLEAEALAQLDALLSEEMEHEEGVATDAARVAYVSERMRLLYVGVTRARQDLIVTWNTGRNGDCVPAVPFLALRSFWDEQPSWGGDGD
ncbi:MAG: ATP-dependent helicase [Anaerolineales bacterium]|nr:ATP-dependent helicase [Anaerolineales bacterium]